MGDTSAENVAWSYLKPVDGAEPIAGLLAFYAHRVEVEVESR